MSARSGVMSAGRNESAGGGMHAGRNESAGGGMHAGRNESAGSGMHAGPTRKPHIVHVFFGQARRLSPMMAELRSLAGEFRQTLIVPGYEQEPAYLAGRIPDTEVVYVRMRSREWSARQTPLLKLLRFKEFMLRAAIAVRRANGEIVVAHDLPAVLPLLVRLVFRPGRVLLHAHELYTEAAEKLAPALPFWRVIERFAVRRVAHVIVPEPNRARIVHEEYGAQRLPAVVMNIPDEPAPYERGSQLRERLALTGEAAIVLYQGLLGESRCIDELVAALDHLPGRFHLVLVGAGEEAFMARLREAEARYNGRLHLFSWMHPEQLQEFTASADVGVLLYRNRGRNNYYAAPNKLYEYLFAGLPVVSSAFPGLRAAIEDGRYGHCADPADPGDVARAILRAAEIIPGADIARRARDTWRWSDQADTLCRLYHELLKKDHAI